MQPVHGPSRDAYADYRGSCRDGDSQPMLLRQKLRSGALAVRGQETRAEQWNQDERAGMARPTFHQPRLTPEDRDSSPATHERETRVIMTGLLPGCGLNVVALKEGVFGIS